MDMGAKGVWLGNLAWPNNRSCGQFAEDVFRIAGATADKQKALAFYDWFIRCMMRGANLNLPSPGGGYCRNYDPLATFTSWGHGECTYWGWVATECLAAAGLKTRRTCVHKQGHTYHECWYAGDDGVEGWHAFDPFQGWYFLNERGEVASCEELAANPMLAQDPFPGHADPLGYHPDRTGLGHRHRTEDALNIDQPVRDEALDWQLQRGMDVSITFRPAEPHQVLLSPEGSRGSHCSVATLSARGEKQYAIHEPYWANYVWPATTTGLPVRWHGAGALRWHPLLQGADASCEAHNAVFEKGCLKPAGPHDFCEVWYCFKLPYLVSYVSVDYDVVGAGGDHFGLCLSTDGGRSRFSMFPSRFTGPGWGCVENGLAQWRAGEATVQGVREFRLRVDLATHNENPTLAVQALRIAVGFQHNMHIQPRLLPGANPLWLEAAEIDDGSRLQAEWVYQQGGAERRAALGLDSAGRGEQVVTIDADRPSDVHTTGLRLKCL